MEQGLLFKQPTYYEEVERKGYTRRDFMRFASLMAAFIGLDSSGIAQAPKPQNPV